MSKEDKKSKSLNDSSTSDNLAAKGMQLLEAINQEIEQGHGQAWKAFLERAVMIAEPLTTAKRQGAESALANKYSVDERDLDFNSDVDDLMKARYATAQALAAEQILEKQLQTNKDNADTWLSRLTKAEQKGESALAEQARQRMLTYKQAADKLDTELVEQRIRSKEMRDKLTRIESAVQEASVQKQILLSRSRTAIAKTALNEVIDKLSSSDRTRAMKELEQKVAELEEVSLRSSKQPNRNDMPDLETALADAKSTLQETLSAVAELATLLKDSKSIP